MASHMVDSKAVVSKINMDSPKVNKGLVGHIKQKSGLVESTYNYTPATRETCTCTKNYIK